jgi:hypothetical protein
VLPGFTIRLRCKWPPPLLTETWCEPDGRVMVVRVLPTNAPSTSIGGDRNRPAEPVPGAVRQTDQFLSEIAQVITERQWQPSPTDCPNASDFGRCGADKATNYRQIGVGSSISSYVVVIVFRRQCQNPTSILRPGLSNATNRASPRHRGQGRFVDQRRNQDRHGLVGDPAKHSRASQHMAHC